MKNIRFISILVISILLLITGSYAAESAPSSWAEPYISNIKSNGELDVSLLLSNYQSNITRGQFAYLSVKLYEYYTGHEVLIGTSSFKDTKDPWVLKAKNAGITNGYNDGTFKPNNTIRREELATLFVNLMKAAEVNYKTEALEKFDDDTAISSWAKQSVYIAKINNIVSGSNGNKFNPLGKASIEQSLIMLDRAMREIEKNPNKVPKLGVDKISLRDVETTTVGDRKVDKIDYPFENDPVIIGTWISVDFVKSPVDFKGTKTWMGDLYWKGITFVENGTTLGSDGRSSQPWWNWTKGILTHNGDKTAARYFVSLVNGEMYLFIEWKSGDYTTGNMQPSFYVFKRATDGEQATW